MNLNQDCPPNSLCQTDFEIDWFAQGYMTFRIRRGCTSNPAPEQCAGGSTASVTYKDCQDSCDPMTDGAGCNTGLDAVASKYSTGNVNECYQCRVLTSAFF